ncbi:DEAD/DEAH box helicase family protein [Streptomyces sp. NPDC005989]|uniref:DEAD/DEAH box helicase n=1 Tax=Streptomyces sp. NPDC005989 TaxID=3156727 RepID=UPI0033D09F53
MLLQRDPGLFWLGNISEAVEERKFLVTLKELFPHQVEAVDAVLRVLQTPASGHLPADGLRTQVIAATGSGKTLIAVAAAEKLGARHVLVLVPTLDLLTQTAAAWRERGRTGAMIGACSLRADDSDGVPCTTDPGELVSWVRGLERVTVFATYAAVGLGILQRAHSAGLGAFDLMVIDEAHRTSGYAGKPWAAVHDQTKMPATRRLYMTATARIWEAPEHAQGGEAGAPRLIASMDPSSRVFGPVAYKLTLSQAVSRGLVAPYQVVCIDISDPEFHQLRQEAGLGSDAARGARLAALQTGLVTAAAEENPRKILTFHSRVSEAEAMAAGVVDAARKLWEDNPQRYPEPGRVWADWLCGEHPPAHRRAVLEEFASDTITNQNQGQGQGRGQGRGRAQLAEDGVGRRSKDGRDGGGGGRGRGGQWSGKGLVPAALRVLSSVKVLGEGVDTANCDSVAFCDARGSMIDIVQMVGRALEPAEEAERPAKRAQDDMWALNLRAAQQYHTREGHLRVPRKHVEHLEGAAEGTETLGGRQAGAGEPVVVKLGTWLDNVRKRADKLTEQRRADLDQLGMRW